MLLLKPDAVLGKKLGYVTLTVGVTTSLPSTPSSSVDALFVSVSTS